MGDVRNPMNLWGPYLLAYNGKLQLSNSGPYTEELGRHYDIPDDDQGRTCLHWACVGKHPDTVLWLSSLPGVDINKQDESGWTPLMIASSAMDRESAEILLRKGARVDIYNENGCGPLHYAASKGSTIITRLLIEYGAEVEHCEKVTKETALHRATATQKHAVMELLLDRGGARTDRQNLHGETPLMLAVQNQDLPAIDLLLQYKADPRLVNYRKQTIEDYCHRDFAPQLREKLVYHSKQEEDGSEEN